MEMPNPTEAIVPCPRCGRRNRVFWIHRGKGFRCGNCHTPFPNPFPAWRRLLGLAMDRPWQAATIATLIGLALISGWAAYSMGSLRTLEATLARQRVDEEAAHRARMQTNEVRHPAALQAEIARQKDAADRELARHRALLADPATVSGETARRKHEGEWSRRQAYEPEFARTPVEKVMVQMHRTADNRQLPFDKIIERVAVLASPPGSRVEVASSNGRLTVRVAFPMSAFNAKEAGAVTTHTSTQAMRAEAVELCARVMRDIYEHCGVRGIDTIQLSCNHAVRPSQRTARASADDPNATADEARVVWSVLYRCNLPKGAAESVRNWHNASLEVIKSLLVVEHDAFDTVVISGRSSDRQSDPADQLKFE